MPKRSMTMAKKSKNKVRLCIDFSDIVEMMEWFESCRREGFLGVRNAKVDELAESAPTPRTDVGVRVLDSLDNKVTSYNTVVVSSTRDGGRFAKLTHPDVKPKVEFEPSAEGV